MNSLSLAVLEAKSDNRDSNEHQNLIDLLERQVNHFSVLSPRESEVVQLIVDGCSNVDIARSLNISIGTVKTHLRGIFTKLNVKDKTTAAVYALRHGLAE